MDSWQPSPRYPDPAVHVLDQSFARYRAERSPRSSGSRPACAGPRARSGSATRRHLVVERHPQQPDDAVGRGDRRRQRLPQAVQLRQRQHPRPPGPPADLRTRRTARVAHRIRRHGDDAGRPVRGQAASTRPTTSSASPTGRSGSPTRRSGCSATTKAPRRSRSCRPTSTGIDAATGALTVVAEGINGPNGLAFSPDEVEAVRRRIPQHAAQHPRL